MITKMDAIRSLDKDLVFHLSKDGEVSLANIDGQENNGTIPSETAIETELSRLKAIHDSTQYQRDRQPNYPPATDYLDGIVKGDQAQIDKYIADCLAIKEKFPKE